MKRNILFLIATLLVALSSCNTEEKMNGTGLLRIGVSTNTSVVTKAGEDIEITNIRLIVKNTTTGNAGNEWSKEYDITPNQENTEIELAPGTYQLTAIAGGDDTENDFMPCYKGTATATVIAGQRTAAKIECTLTTVKVSVEYASSLISAYGETEFKTEIAGLSFSKNETRAGYITPGSLSVNFMFKDQSGNWQTIQLSDIAKAQAREYYKIKISVENTGDGSSEGAANITIQVGEENPENVTIEIILPKIQTLDAEVSYYSATLNGSYSVSSGNEPTADKLFFLYRKKAEPSTEWIKVPAAFKENVNGVLTYQAVLQELNDDTGYEYRFMEKEKVNIKDFTTKKDAIKTLPANVWSKFAYLKGVKASNPDVSKVSFEWKGKGDTEWQKITNNIIKVDDGTYQVILKDLEPGKEYEYRFDTSSALEFKTVDAIQFPYSDFETWSKKKPSKWLPAFTYYLGSQSDANNYDAFWDSGNKGTSTGAAALAYKNPTQPVDGKRTAGSGSKVAYLKSQYVGLGGSLGQFAAGNLYIGKYGETIGTSGAKINFGRKWTVRPTSLHGWYKYSPGTVNYQGGNGPTMKDKQDQCAIYIVLVKAKSPVSTELYHLLDNTNIETFIDFSQKNKDIIAYGEISQSQSLGSKNKDWEEFDISLIYRDINANPTHVLVVTSASKYGDYFTGSTDSEMWLDDFELKYDYNEASHEPTN